MKVPSSAPLVIDRYAIYREIAAGGMATVHLARLVGPAGFSRTVAVKRLLPHLTRDESFSVMLIDEARMAARIRHPNVVSTLDVIATDGELLIVMDYIHGESLSRLFRAVKERGERIPVPIAAAILIDTLHGLHAAHEATAEDGTPLNLVHRDVSPQNLLVGADGITRIADFGIAKALGRAQVTRDRTVKGKLSYMAPEQIQFEELTRATDIFAASIVLWELLAGTRLFKGENDAQIIHKVLSWQIPPVSEYASDVPPEFDDILARGLARNPQARFATARDMALAIEKCVPAIRASEIGAWVEETAKEALGQRSQILSSIERSADLPLEHAETAISDRPVQLGEINAYAPTAVQDRTGITAPATWTSRSHRPEKAANGTRAVPIARPGSQETTAPSATARRGSGLWIAVGAVLIVPLFIGSFFIARRTHDQAESSAPSTLPASVGLNGEDAAQYVKPELAPVAQPAPERPKPPEPPEPASAAASAATPTNPPERVPDRQKTVRPSKVAPTVRPARTKTEPETNCDPPYSIDSQGRRIFKLECM